MRPAACIAIALLGYWSASAGSTIREVTVVGGKVEGTFDDGVASFKGVPYAAAPLGALRWQAPQSVIPWKGVRKTNSFALPCPQSVARSDWSEDCLYLNIWTAASSAREKRPVMVWIHGGGFVAGTTSNPVLDGTQLARRGVVLVSIAYRLGPLGFLAHPDLDHQRGGGSGEFGLQDQIAGLRWVRDNIAGFGGDPRRVTIFGQSAGGISVNVLAAAPAARNLFQRAISESGPKVFEATQSARSPGELLRPLQAAEADGVEFLRTLGAPDIQTARELPVSSLVGRYTPGRFAPVIGGSLLPRPVYAAYAAGDFNATPVLIGYNSADGALDAPPNATPAMFDSLLNVVPSSCKSHAAAVLSTYPHASDAEALQAIKALARDVSYGWNTWTWARLQTRSGRGRVYVYYFDVRTPHSPEGSAHQAEIPYVFGTLGPSAAAEDIQLSTLIRQYWSNFSAKGDPNGPGLPWWPAFRPESPQMMIFGHSGSPQPWQNADRMRLIDNYLGCTRAN